MKKRVLSLWMAALSVAMFGVLYPEYILLPATYEYIIEENPQEEETDIWKGYTAADITELLYAEPEKIRVSSKILQYIAEEGKIIWKNRD